MSAHRTRSAAVGSLAIAALVASAVPALAQEDALPSFTPEEEAKLKAFVAFVENADEFLPTVNQYDLGSLPVTFPVREVGKQLVVDVVVGDSEPQQMMLDSGAPTQVTQDVADANGGEVIVETVSRAGGNILTFNPLQLYPSITVGGALTITDAIAQSPWEAAGSFACVAPGGLFGAMNMLNAVWQFDYSVPEVTVAASVDQLDHVDGAIAVPFAAGGLSPTPHVQLQLGDTPVEFIVDTGGGIPLAITNASMDAAGLQIPDDAPSAQTFAGGAGGAFSAPLEFVDVPITFGDTELTVRAIVSDVMSPGSGGNIGHDFLKNFVVTIDWSTNTLYLEPLFEGDVVPPPGPASSAGFALAGEGTLIVSAVADGGPAQEAGLTLGEVITMIDGQDVEGITVDEYCALTAVESHETITTETGTYDASPVEDFYASLEE